MLISKALWWALVNEGFHSFICHPDVYPQTEWAIMPLLPSFRASVHFDRYSFLGKVGRWVGL